MNNDQADARAPVPPRRPLLPRGVWALGFVSLFMDFSSEMIHAVLPLFLVSALGASTITVGLIEGTAEATANVAKVFSGVLSDRLGRRKRLVVAGYGLAAATKPFFALANTVGLVFGARLFDRLGKGIRGAPRDALIADLTPAPLRGASYGLRQSLDTVGAVLGPLVAMGIMLLTADAFKTVFWVATAPAVCAVGVLLWGVKDPGRSSLTKGAPPLDLGAIRQLGEAFWGVVAVAAVLTLARFSEAFLLLRGESAGLALSLVPVVMVTMNVAYALSAYPAGALSDRLGRWPMLSLGVAFLIIADLVLALGQSVASVLMGVVLWGLHMGFTQGLFATLVADTAPERLRGSAFGLLNLAIGLAMLGASVIAGVLWEAYGPSMTFEAGAAFAGLSLVGMVVLRALRKEANGEG